MLQQLSNKRISYLCVIIISACFLFNYTQIFDFKPDLNGDNAYYYSLAKSLLQGKGYTNIISSHETPHTHFPPGYPLFSAGVLLFFKSYTSLKIANGVLLLFSILLLFFFTRKISGSTIVALSSSILCCMQPELLRYATIVMSEMLFTFLSLLVFYLASKIDSDHLFGNKISRSQLYQFLLLTIVLCYIYFVRTMGTSIILATIIFYGIICCQKGYNYLKQRTADSKRILISNLIILTVLAGSFFSTKTAWDIRNINLGVTQSDYLKDFKKKTHGGQMTSFADWSQRIKNNFTSYTTKWIPSAILPYDYETQSTPSKQDWLRGLFVIALIIMGFELSQKLHLLLFLYIGITMGVLLFWPEQYTSHRYFIGLIPLFIFLFIHGIFKATAVIFQNIPTVRNSKSAPSIILIATLIFLLIPQYHGALKGQKFLATYKSWNPNIASEAFIEYAYAVKWCKENLPKSARIACRKADLYYLISGGQKAETFPQYGKPEVIFERFKKAGITHVIIDRWFRHGYVTIYPLISTHYRNYFRPLVQFGENTQRRLPTLVFEFNPNGFVSNDSIGTEK